MLPESSQGRAESKRGSDDSLQVLAASKLEMPVITVQMYYIDVVARNELNLAVL